MLLLNNYCLILLIPVVSGSSGILDSNRCDTHPNCDGDVRLFETLRDLQQVSYQLIDKDINETASNHYYPLTRVKRAFAPYKTGKAVADQVSSTLDQLLKHSGYDKRIRPQLGGPPVSVTINLSIRSMGPVDENRRAFSLDCYFRQSWFDARLRYNASSVDELALNWAFLAKIWKPDTFFVNGKKSYLHKITVSCS